MAVSRPAIRLFVEAPLREGAIVALSEPQAHYLRHVMRRGPGDEIALFNGCDGEWRGRLEMPGKKSVSAVVTTCLRPFPANGQEMDVWLVFAPIKRTPADFLVAKATELGVAALWPVFTGRTVVTRLKEERLRANMVEAAEQSERLSVPDLLPPVPLEDMIARWPAERRLLLCDESGGGGPIAKVLSSCPAAEKVAPWAILTGPEGGFTPAELDALRNLPFVTPVGLGPRVLRADTAALAALTCWQALIGDWQGQPSFRGAMSAD